MEKEFLPFQNQEMTPAQIVAELDKYIIGQEAAKKAVAIALRNRTRRRKLPEELREEISPKNIIMIGPTGVGKTEIARRLSKLANAPFIKVEATKYTEVGYVGRDVESMVRDLVSIAINLVKSEFRSLNESKAQIRTIERILDILLPSTSGSAQSTTTVFDNRTEEEERERKIAESRNRMKEKLEQGDLDERIIEFEIKSNSGMPMMQVLATGMDDLENNLQNLLGDILPKQSKKRKMSISEAKKIIFEEELEKLLDQEKISEEAVRRTQEMGIIFIDEIDKIAGRDGRSGPDISREGVQRDILPIVEGSTVSTKYGPVKTDHILFIASGAFHISKPSDLIPELQGRFPIRVELQSLSRADFIAILSLPQNSLIRQYSSLLETEGVSLHFTDDSLEEIANIALKINEETENIGARRLHTIMEKLLEEISFQAPDLPEDKKNIEIDAHFVRERLHTIIIDRDLTKYIL